MSERIFLQSYCEKHGVSFIDCEAGVVDRTLLRKVSIKYLSRQRIVPLSLKEGRLNVVAEDLQQASGVTAELERLYGAPVTFWISEKSKIASTLTTLEAEAGEGKVTSTRRVEYKNVSATAVAVTDDTRGAAEIVESILLRDP